MFRLRRMGFLLGVLGVMATLMLVGKVWGTPTNGLARESGVPSRAGPLEPPNPLQQAREDVVAVACQFSGPARLHLAPAPPGTRVEARVDGEKVAETEVVSQGDESIFIFTLDRRYAGRTVVFRFPAYPQLGEAGRATCELGQRQALTLSAETHRGCGGG